jgi:hypothetical protein
MSCRRSLLVVIGARSCAAAAATLPRRFYNFRGIRAIKLSL